GRGRGLLGERSRMWLACRCCGGCCRIGSSAHAHPIWRGDLETFSTVLKQFNTLMNRCNRNSAAVFCLDITEPNDTIFNRVKRFNGGGSYPYCVAAPARQTLAPTASRRIGGRGSRCRIQPALLGNRFVGAGHPSVLRRQLRFDRK